MKVRVTYTVDYEETPSVVENLITRCREDLRSASQFKFNALKLEETAAELLVVQEKLSLISEQLNDCYNMAAGYASVQKEMLTESSAPQAEVVNEDD
jgi:hypothetical protein|tara:strand:+ start:340 stop:630 length:291 start_codon:yes stop_codon:yes gene_type:complete